LRSIAERTGQLDGSETYWCGEDGVWVDVWLAASHLQQPRPSSTAKAAHIHSPQLLALLISMQGRGLWSKMPSVMIAKCSEAQALRRAFPADLSGVYSTDEMDQAVEPVTVNHSTSTAG
jgi:hypothetical protein